MQRPEHEIVALGAGCKTILSDDTFNRLFREYSDASLDAIVQSQPHETKLREFEYTRLHALKGFTNFLVSFVEAAQNIINKDLTEDEPD